MAWRTFLRNEIARIWAADLFVVPTLTFKRLYVLFFIEHVRRHLVQLNVTQHPLLSSSLTTTEIGRTGAWH